MRAELDTAWQQYLRAARGSRRGQGQDRRRRSAQLDSAARALVDALASQRELDDLARLLTGLHPEVRGEQLPIARLLQADVVLPFVYRHRFEHDVLDWALEHSWDLFEQSGVFEDFAAFDHVTHDDALGARYYLLTQSNQPRHWQRLLHQRVQTIDFLLHEMSSGVGPLAPPQEVAKHLLAALALYDQAPPAVFEPWVRDELDIYRAELRDWLRYEGAGRPGGDFPAWCAAAGSTHRFSTGHPPRLMNAYFSPPRR